LAFGETPRLHETRERIRCVGYFTAVDVEHFAVDATEDGHLLESRVRPKPSTRPARVD
jgi:hypothetical protein